MRKTKTWSGMDDSKKKHPALMHERAAGLLPGIDAALDVAGGGEPGILRGAHRHRRTLAEGAVEDHALAGGAGKLIEHATGPDIGREIGIGRVQGARDDAMLLAFRALAQVDQDDVRSAVERHHLGG